LNCRAEDNLNWKASVWLAEGHQADSICNELLPLAL